MLGLRLQAGGVPVRAATKKNLSREVSLESIQEKRCSSWKIVLQEGDYNCSLVPALERAKPVS